MLTTLITLKQYPKIQQQYANKQNNLSSKVAWNLMIAKRTKVIGEYCSIANLRKLIKF